MWDYPNYLLTASINGKSAIYKMPFDTKVALMERLGELESFCTTHNIDMEAAIYQLNAIVKLSQINHK